MVSRFEEFSSSIFAINRCIQKIERIEMAKFGLKGPQAQCLLAMARYPEGITSSQLRAVCDKDKAAISRTVAELEREGMVERHTNNGNRYRAMLKLTAAGKDAAAQVAERARIAVESAGGGMTDAQRTTLYASLHLIAGRLQAICAEGLEEQE